MIIENTSFIYRNCKESSKHEEKEFNEHISNYWKLCLRIQGGQKCVLGISPFKEPIYSKENRKESSLYVQHESKCTKKHYYELS